MAERVSWLMIRPGWKVYASDGTEVGAVDAVAGDETEDIFDGLAVAPSALGKPRYVPADQVADITNGAIHLAITAQQAVALGEYLEPATTAEIEAGDGTGIGSKIAAEARELEGKVFAPIQQHEQPMNLWRRILFFFRRR